MIQLRQVFRYEWQAKRWLFVGEIEKMNPTEHYFTPEEPEKPKGDKGAGKNYRA